MKATSVSLSILFTIAEKSVVVFVTENRCTATPLAFRYASTVFGEALRVGLLRVEDGDLLGAELA